MRYINHSQFRRSGFVVLIVTTILLVMLLLDPWLGMSKSPFLLFFSAVMVSGWYGGLKSGVLATVLSTLVSRFFFVEPKYSLLVDLPDFLRIGLFASQGLLFSILCEELKTAKRRAEKNLQKLKVSEERFRLALTSSDIVVFQQDRDLRYDWIHNSQGVQLAGEMVGKSDYQLFSTSGLEQLTAIKRRVIETGISICEEVCLINEGQIRFYDLLVEPFRDESDRIQGITCVALNVTERKQAELETATLSQELETAIQRQDESLALLNACLTSSPVALGFLDTELRYVYVNEALAALNGLPQSQHIGFTLREVLPEWAPQVEPILRQIMETREPLLNQELRGETFPGEVYRYGLVSYYPVSLPDGRLLGVGITAMDITQLKLTEQALRQSEAKFRSVVESNMIGIGFWDKNGRITEANDALLSMVGYTREELINSNLSWQDLTPPEYLPLDEQALTQLQYSSFSTPFEKEYIRKDGSRLPILLGGSHFEDSVDQGTFFVLDITERKRVEIALRESEARFRAMFDQAAVGIALVALDGRFLQINPALCEITGYNYEELIQMKFQEITHPNDLETDWEYGRRVLAKEISGYSLEKRYIRKDGSIVWVNLTSSAVWDANGQAKYAVGIIEDISERQAALHERKRAEAEQQFLVEASTLLATSLDYEIALVNVANLVVPTLADWCVVDIFPEDGSSQQIALVTADPGKRKALEEIRRRYPPKIGVKDYLRKLEPENSGFYPELTDSILEQMAQDEEHLQLLRSLGIRSLMVIPLSSREQLFGAICFFTAESDHHYELTDLALAEDIARRAATAIDNARLYQETQQAKQEAERAVNRTVRLQKITAALSEALTSQQVADVVVNQGIRALGATAGSVVLLAEEGATIKVVQAIGYPQLLLDTWKSFPITASVPIAETLRTGQPIFVESVDAFIAKYPHLANALATTGNCAFACIPLIVEGKTIGGLALSFNTAQAFAQEDRGFMLTLGQQCALAIARAQLYEAEKAARAEAETANRIKDEFLAVLSHELRTPLNPILGWAKLLRTRKHDEATVDRALETIERNAKLQTQLIEDLLDVSRILQGKLSLNIRAVDLRVTIIAALETVRLAAEAKSIQVKTLLSNQIIQVMGDGDRLQQVIWNLVSNAVKFTPTGGQVEIRLETVGLDAQIQVIDTGFGITPEFLPHVFEYFRQADAKTTRVFGGLGLGLAIVRHLVELHGGTVQVESPGKDQGATFTCKLPLLKSSELPCSNPEPANLEQCTKNLLLSGVQILLVDDQADVRELFCFMLEEYGATVKAVASAEAALFALAKSQPDILLSDIGMPIIDGYMLLRRVRKLPPARGGQIPAIALTAYAGEIDYRQAMAAGFQKHVTKPVDPEDLAKAIAELLGRHQP
ncbi:PAS domain S-box [Cylindrospermum stagnale PCC 7417]|uniref:Circadian input-output histidine kinase CikA n=1 Tax=Cylindrospermum stagnale PCC 7417 TaxID=56107 RepID=K9WRB2_9NOST|nr:PAS domain S-box protein [Cylindrospermum stagnale]AFZ22930.1 PAS domain S-box [Cylindrospermum stagnale PCC 7417]